MFIRRARCDLVLLIRMVTTYSKSKDQSAGKVANPARDQLNREMFFSLSPFAPENLVPRDSFGSPVPRRPAHLHAQLGAYLRDSSRVPWRCPIIYLFISCHHTPSGQSRVIGSHNCVPMASTAESTPAQGQLTSR